MARWLTLLDDEEFAAVCARLDAGGTDRDDLRAATKHTLALLQAKAPGSSVELERLLADVDPTVRCWNVTATLPPRS